MKTSFAAVELELQDGKVDVHQENFLSAKSKYCSWLEVLHTRHKRAILIWTQKRKCYSNQVSPFTNEQKALSALCFS